VADIDDVFTGNEHLRALGKYEHIVGDRTASARQPDLRLLVGPLGPGARALVGHRSLNRKNART